jgi:hypothetical protein
MSSINGSSLRSSIIDVRMLDVGTVVMFVMLTARLDNGGETRFGNGVPPRKVGFKPETLSSPFW